MAARRGGWTVWVIMFALGVAACSGDDGGGGGADQASAPPSEAQTTAPGATVSEQATDGGVDESGGGQTYVIRSGDTLSEIARRFDTSVEALVEANDIADPDVIDVGQELTIP